MRLTVEPEADRTIVRVDEPRLDAAIALSFKERMREIVPTAGPVLLIDLEAVQFMDSSGLGALIAIHKALPARMRLELAALGPNVMRVFRLTRMDSVFTIHDAAPSRPAPALAGAGHPAGLATGEART